MDKHRKQIDHKWGGGAGESSRQIVEKLPKHLNTGKRSFKASRR
jgi:hypothetical protein